MNPYRGTLPVTSFDFRENPLTRLLRRFLPVVLFVFGSFRKLGVPYFGGPYNKDPTI